MSTRHFEPTVQLDSGLIIPAGAGLGLQLTSDASGDATWVNDNNDALQAGFIGTVNTGVITCAMSGSDLSFTNWPTGDGYYFPTASGPLVRAIVPSAPATIAPSGVTSGDYAYVQVYLTPPTTAGGTATVGYSVGTSRTTAALAAADQRGAAATSTNVLVWDGIVLNTSGTYTLVAGTPASGSVIPATTGRDRRVWARGAFFSQTNGSGNTSTAAINTWYLISSNLQSRIECSGAPLRVILQAWGSNSLAGYGAVTTLFIDGVVVSVSGNTILGWVDMNSAGSVGPVGYEFVYTPTPGSHLLAPYYGCPAGTMTLFTGSGYIQGFSAQELLAPNASNGTT